MVKQGIIEFQNSITGFNVIIDNLLMTSSPREMVVEIIITFLFIVLNLKTEKNIENDTNKKTWEQCSL